MVGIICWCCKKNLGNRKCERFPEGIDIKYIPQGCEAFEESTKEENLEKMERGIDLLWRIEEKSKWETFKERIVSFLFR